MGELTHPGEFFEDDYPVKRYSPETNIQWAKRKGARKKDAVRGVIRYCEHKGVSKQNEQNELIVRFCNWSGFALPERHYIRAACIHIQLNWEVFVKWIKKEIE